MTYSFHSKGIIIPGSSQSCTKMSYFSQNCLIYYNKCSYRSCLGRTLVGNDNFGLFLKGFPNQMTGMSTNNHCQWRFACSTFEKLINKECLCCYGLSQGNFLWKKNGFWCDPLDGNQHLTFLRTQNGIPLRWVSISEAQFIVIKKSGKGTGPDIFTWILVLIAKAFSVAGWNIFLLWLSDLDLWSSDDFGN